MKNVNNLIDNSGVNYAIPSEKQLLEEGAQFLKSMGNNPNIKKISENVNVKKTVSSTPISAAALNASGASANSGSVSDTEHKVKLVANDNDVPPYDGPQGRLAFIASDISYKMVEFDNMPRITKSMGVTYEPIEPPHLPAPFQKFKKTDGVTYQLDATFTSRTQDEAFRNYIFCLNLEAWTKPFFGKKQMGANGTRGKLGAPPPVLFFSGYRGLINVPVAINRLEIPKPNDCDWISTGYNNIPFPTVLTVSIGLIEIYSADQLNSFDLGLYRLGGNSTIPSQPNTIQPQQSTSGIKDPTSGNTPPGSIFDMQPWDLQPWELGKPEFK